MLFEFYKKNTTRFQLHVACKVQFKNKKHIYLFKHPLLVAALVTKILTFDMA